MSNRILKTSNQAFLSFSLLWTATHHNLTKLEYLTIRNLPSDSVFSCIEAAYILLSYVNNFSQKDKTMASDVGRLGAHVYCLYWVAIRDFHRPFQVKDFTVLETTSLSLRDFRRGFLEKLDMQRQLSHSAT